MTKNLKSKSSYSLYALNVNGLHGRMEYLPKQSGTNNILLIYDALSDIENWQHFIEILNKFGSVSCIDLPGFGGMESFYRLKERPTLDIFADYLAAIIKLRYRRKRLTIVGIGFGFVIATRMLQKYPEILRKTQLIISVDGYSRFDDFNISRTKRYILSPVYYIGSYLIPSLLVRSLFYNQTSMNFRYNHLSSSDFYKKLNDVNKLLFIEAKKSQIRKNNLRTYMMYKYQVLKLDNCRKQLNIPLWHVSLSSSDRSEKVVEQHLQVIYKDFHQSKVKMENDLLIMQNKQIANRLLPAKLRRLLSQIQ